MSRYDALRAYSAEALSFAFAAGADAIAPPLAPPLAPEADALERLAVRALAAYGRSGRETLVLLGLGSGALAERLAAELPPERLCVCEADLPRARALASAGRLGWWRAGGPGLCADASPWAALVLLVRAGLIPGEVFVLPNPELPPDAKARLKPLELLLTRSEPVTPLAAAPVPDLCCAAILRPDEPDLAGFFAQFPHWVAGLSLVWDADEVPQFPLPQGVPATQVARRLGGDFSAQRNAMLAACRSPWLLYLDADERLSPEAWAALPGLCATPGVVGWHLPRVTPYPDADHAMMGFGLWPDIQLRLFRNAPGLRFVNPVHERLSGVAGGQALALTVEIEHLSRLRKSEDELRRKLSGFDAAGGEAVRHVLNAEYPRVERDVLAPRGSRGPGGLLLPAGLVAPS